MKLNKTEYVCITTQEARALLKAQVSHYDAKTGRWNLQRPQVPRLKAGNAEGVRTHRYFGRDQMAHFAPRTPRVCATATTTEGLS